MPEEVNPLGRVILPRRWEQLVTSAHQASTSPEQLVERVDDAANRVDGLLRRLRDGGGGLIEVVYGLSGSGKTTFLKTLPKFFDGVRVTSFDRERSLSELPQFIESDWAAGQGAGRIIVIERRDNPSRIDLTEIEEMFGQLLDTFRQENGSAIVLWPITDRAKADQVRERAWQTGRDSMTDPISKGLFHFTGLPKERYWTLADNTSRTLSGDGLEAHGLTEAITSAYLPDCDTISDFFAKTYSEAEKNRAVTWSVLKEKVIPHLWVLLPGDDAKLVSSTADALTQGTKSKIDIDKIGEIIDRPNQEAIYINKWRDRRGQLAHWLRSVDVRLFGIPPNVALAAIRACADEDLRSHLKQPRTNLDAAKRALRNSRVYKAILETAGVEATEYAGPRKINRETSEEFIRIQKIAARGDKRLNHALGKLIEKCLETDAPHLKVSIERKSLPNSSLKPDISIEISRNEFICLEPTWRTSGKGIPEEVEPSQNTLAEAHIKKYVLDKVNDYVEDLQL